ncbi:MAG: TonB-dependent receptor [Acidobacteria bacterium]|nr:MAG: TonB-dependent receptor [Acidobacteriota bacterium]
MTNRCVLISALAILLATAAFGQFEAGSVLGTVRDASGGVIQGGKITLTNLETGISAVAATDANGNYEFPAVKVGLYKVAAEQTGFSTAVANNVRVNVSSRQRVDLQLAVGQVTETVQATAAAPLVETETSQRDQVISHEASSELPLNGRQYSSLVLLTSGVKVSPIGTGSNVTVLTREGSFNVNGLRSTFSNYMLDGLDNNAYGTSNQGFSNQVIQPPPDSVAEFQVVTNNESAEYGRSAGATINVAYASGTNQLHLNLWEFLRNTDLNAVGFFRPRVGNNFPFHRNQFGGTLGGPIVKNRAFFFLDYEGFRQIRNIPTFLTIPSLAQRQGILPVTVTNPLTGKSYPAGTQIPAADLQPWAAKVLADLPPPTFPTASGAAPANNYLISQPFKNFNDKFNAKFDYQLTDKMNGFLRLGQLKANIFDTPPIPLPSGGAGNSATRILDQQIATGMNWVPSASQVFEFRFGVSRTQAGKNPAALGLPNALQLYSIPGLPTDPRISGGLPTELTSGYADLGRQATNPQWQYPTVYNPKVNYSRILGRHSLKIGYEYQRILTEVMDVNPLYGRDSYTSKFSGDNFGDFLFGLRSQYALSTLFVAHLQQNMHFAYVQDDFKFSNKLTLNLGVRYEYGSPQFEADNRLSNFDPATATILKAKEGSSYDRGLVHPDLGDWAPRVGIAYQVMPKTVIRSGFGISYVHFHRSGAANLLPINGPKVVNAVINQTPGQPGLPTTQQGYPARLADPANLNPLTANISYLPSNTKHTYVGSWFFSIQREIARNTLVDVAYVGNRSNRLLLFANFNQAQPNQPGQTLGLAQRQNTRPYPQWGDITYDWNGGFSDYHSLQVRLEHRFSGGLFFLNSFTWSKAIDNAAGSLEDPNGNVNAPQNFFNLKAEKGLSAYDQPLTNTTSVLYQLPFGKGRRYGANLPALADLFLGGWEISSINSAFSGQPITIAYGAVPGAAFQVSGIQQDFRGSNNYRVNIIGDPVNHSANHILHFWNLNNILVPTDPARPFGNAGRNIARSDPFWQWDFAANKNFALPWESMRLQFRAEIFNLLNHTNFLTPNSVCGSNNAAGLCTQGSFGTITSTYDPRLVQFGLKLSF